MQTKKDDKKGDRLKVRLFGWYPPRSYEYVDRWVMRKEDYVYTAKDFFVEDLEVLPGEKLMGKYPLGSEFLGFLFSEFVLEVVDVKDPETYFYITKEEGEKLRKTQALSMHPLSVWSNKKTKDLPWYASPALRRPKRTV